MKIKDKLLGLWNFWPPFVGAGIRIQKVTPDYRYMRVEMPLRFYNSNYVGTQFGGSMFSMTDPFYMVMLLRNLGKSYIVWDKAASIRYVKPGRGLVYAEFELNDNLLNEIRTVVDQQGKADWPFKVLIKDLEGQTIAEVDKTLYIKKKT